VSPAEPPIVAVVGGGLTGLCAARAIEQATEHRVVLLEAGDRLGGKLFTDRLAGMTIEGGADSFLARDPSAVDLCRALGLEDELIPPAEYGALIWTDSGLKPLPTGFLRGFPTGVGAALRADVLSFGGALRTIGDLVLPGPLRGPDVSLGDFTRKRFGRELLEQLVDPVLAGTRAGRAEEISLQAAAPEIDRAARAHRSVMRGLGKMRSAGQIESGSPPFLTLRSGMSTLIDRLAASLTRTQVRTSTPVIALTSTGKRLVLTTPADTFEVDGLVLTVPSFAAADLVTDLAPTTAHALRRIEYASVAGVSLVFPTSATTLPAGSGLLVPRSARRSISACTWFSKKWPQHAGDERLTIRCFIGRAGREEILEQPDEELVQLALDDLRTAIGIKIAPLDARVTRWDRSLPQYRVGHLSLVDDAEAGLEGYPIELAGAGYRGSGIPDCVRQGSDAARRLALRL
jgi:oxygen-dependent protoporphyrinogen oxidase